MRSQYFTAKVASFLRFIVLPFDDGCGSPLEKVDLTLHHLHKSDKQLEHQSNEGLLVVCSCAP